MAIPSRYRRHLMWATLAFGFLFVNFFRNSTAVLAGDLAAVFDATAAELGLLHSSFFYVYAAAQLPSGLLVDRYGPRRVVSIGLAGMAVGVAGFAAADSFAFGFAARFLAGLSGAAIYVAVLRFCANWYAPEEFATMTGFTIAAAGIGGVLATTPLALAAGAAGWRTVLYAAAAGVFLAALAVGVFVRDRPADPDDRPAGADSGTDTDSFREVLAGARRVLGDVDTWLMGVALFLIFGLNFTVIGLWGVPYIVHLYDVPVATAATAVLAANVGFAIGSPAFGALSDRTGRRTEVIVASCVVFVLSYGVIFVAITPPLAVVALVLFLGMGMTGGASVAYTVAKERHLEDSGAATGTVNGMAYFGAAVFPAVLGAALDAYWTGRVVDGARAYTPAGYRVAFGIVVAGGVVATVCALALHVRQRRRGEGADAVAASAAGDD
ncbi:MFS transporter [Halobaculum sp. CBA1158]|uniref:MFS transporter n=1 Tax=Halobaculum sp. CBA1158 TaxID=2904243 RepID=UPI001F371095|nr:MFS transporter [Halobaculum sp. CBA1158]UIO98691.1 MFS transporter [Halobaculum sp. CBA1158]